MNKYVERGITLAALVALALLLLVLVSPAVAILRAALANYAFDTSTWNDPEADKLLIYDDGRYSNINYINDQLQDATVLTFRQSDVSFYAKSAYRSHLDPTFLPLFATDVDAASTSGSLIQQGVTHVLSPSYAVPAIYESSFSALLGDPCLTKIVHESRGYRLSELVDNCPRSVKTTPHIPRFTVQTKERVVPAFVEDTTVKVTNPPNPIGGTAGKQPVDLIQCSGPIDHYDHTCHEPAQNYPGSIHTLRLQWTRTGRVQVLAHLYTKDNAYVESVKIYDEIAQPGESQNTDIQFAVPTQKMRIGLRVWPGASVELNDLSITQWDRPGPDRQSAMALAMQQDWEASAPGRSTTEIIWGLDEKNVGFLVATDGRPYTLRTGPVGAPALPTIIRARLSGVGEAKLSVQIRCKLEPCGATLPLQRVFLQETPTDYTVELDEEQLNELRRNMQLSVLDRFFNATEDNQPVIEWALVVEIQKNKRRYRGSAWYNSKIYVYNFTGA